MQKKLEPLGSNADDNTAGRHSRKSYQSVFIEKHYDGNIHRLRCAFPVFRHNCIRYEQDKRNRYGFSWKRQKALYLRRYAALSGFHKYFPEIAGAVCKEKIKITLLKILFNRCGFVDADKKTKIKRFCQRIYIKWYL